MEIAWHKKYHNQLVEISEFDDVHILMMKIYYLPWLCYLFQQNKFPVPNYLLSQSIRKNSIHCDLLIHLTNCITHESFFHKIDFIIPSKAIFCNLFIFM